MIPCIILYLLITGIVVTSFGILIISGDYLSDKCPRCGAVILPEEFSIGEYQTCHKCGWSRPIEKKKKKGI